MRGWERDKSWSDAFMPEIKAILGSYLIQEAPVEMDQSNNTDLIVLKLDTVRVACRIRRPGYFEKYGHQFTIRSSRPNGTKTELAKVIEGWGDYIFYAHAENDVNLLAWGLGDLKVFRLWYMRQIAKMPAGCCPGEARPNKDRSSEFVAFGWGELPEGFVVAESGISEVAGNRLEF